MFFTSFPVLQQVTRCCNRTGRRIAFLIKHGNIVQCQFVPRFSHSGTRATYELKAGPWGTFSVDSEQFDNIIIVPLDAHTCPAQNKVVINFTKGNHVLDKTDVEKSLSATVENNIVALKDVGDKGMEKLSCHVQLPLKMDVKATLRGNTSIGIEKMESENLDLSVEHGKCLLKSIQGRDVTLNSDGGDIILKSFIQGNIQIKGQNQTNIEAERIQGLSLDIAISSGTIRVKDIYADKSSFTIDSGHVHLGNCHRDAKVKVIKTGQLTVDSIDGNLTADVQEGDINLYAVKHEHVDVHTQHGNINVKVLDTADTNVDLKADSIELDDQLHIDGKIAKDNNIVNCVSGHMESISSGNSGNGSSRLIKAHTDSGNISVKCQDWLSSLNLMSK